jgi:hypothetical protein
MPPKVQGKMAMEPGHDEDQGEFKWYTWCPQGEQCSKGQKTLGGYWSESRAREAVFTHLHASSYHLMDEDSARMEAELACVEKVCVAEGEAEDNFEPTRPHSPDEPPIKRRKGGGGGGGGKGSSSSASGSIRVGGGGAGNTAMVKASATLQQQITSQTRNSIVFVKAMTKAEKALRLAAKVSRGAMETFQDRLGLRALLKGILAVFRQV